MRECVRPTRHDQRNVGERFTYIHLSPSLSPVWWLCNILVAVEFSYPDFQHSSLVILLLYQGKVVANIGGERIWSGKRWDLTSK